MPKLKLEYGAALKETLRALGMAIAFDDSRADFSNMVGPPARPYISEVKHRTFVEVNEEGTEAAAATSVEVGLRSAPPTMTVDRPYLCAIRERLSGTVLFLGLIVDPSLAR